MRIVIKVNQDRSRLGTLELYKEDERLLGPLPCLAEADPETAFLRGNPSRNPKHCFGHTPIGVYIVPEQIQYSEGKTNERTFGQHTSLLIEPDPQSCHIGDAWEAKRNGRRRIMIHGGHLSLEGHLRPTHGCIRLSEESQQLLIRNLEQQFETAGMSLKCLRVEISEVSDQLAD